MADTVLVIAETRGGAITPLTRELLGVAGTVGTAVVSLLISETDAPAQDLIAHGADRVYWCKGVEDYDAALWMPAAERLAREIAPAFVIAGHTHAGAEIAPRLAFRLGGAVATGCTAVEGRGGELHFTRPCYGGNVREQVAFRGSPACVTIKAGVGEARHDPSRRGEVIALDAPGLDTRTRVVGREREAAGASRLEDAKVIVAGGRGLEGPEGFEVIRALADQLGGTVGASRVPCDLGWCPHSWQIGLTGKTVTPDLYVAVGISGAGHHLAGCGNSKTIVAINSDPDAAIFREARFGIVGDYRKVIPALIEALKET